MDSLNITAHSSVSEKDLKSSNVDTHYPIEIYSRVCGLMMSGSHGTSLLVGKENPKAMVVGGKRDQQG